MGQQCPPQVVVRLKQESGPNIHKAQAPDPSLGKLGLCSCRPQWTVTVDAASGCEKQLCWTVGSWSHPDTLHVQDGLKNYVEGSVHLRPGHC